MNLTKRQAKICRCIIRKKRLNTVLRECGIADYIQLQELIPTKYLIFSDCKFDDATTVALESELLSDYEARCELRRQTLLAEIFSTIALIISLISLSIDIYELLMRLC